MPIVNKKLCFYCKDRRVKKENPIQSNLEKSPNKSFLLRGLMASDLESIS